MSSSSQQPTVATDERENLKAIIDKKRCRANVGAKAWSSAHHSLLAVSILCAALAALFTKLDSPPDPKQDQQKEGQANANDVGQKAQIDDEEARENRIAVLAALAALATTANATLNLRQKWIANRGTRAAIDNLKVDFTDPNMSLDDVRQELKNILTRHEEVLTT